MAVKHFQSIQFADPDMQLLTSRIQEAVNSMTSNPLLNGNLLQARQLIAGSNLVSHGLGRKYRSFFVGNMSGPMRVSFAASPDPATFVNLVSDAAGVVDLLIL